MALALLLVVLLAVLLAVAALSFPGDGRGGEETPRFIAGVARQALLAGGGRAAGAGRSALQAGLLAYCFLF